jgi:hypothetical protein
MKETGSATASMAPGADASVKITEGYARLVARDAYFWAWPMVNIYNRRLFDELPAVLRDAPPLPGEEARYAQVRPAAEQLELDLE